MKNYGNFFIVFFHSCAVFIFLQIFLIILGSRVKGVLKFKIFAYAENFFRILLSFETFFGNFLFKNFFFVYIIFFLNICFVSFDSQNIFLQHLLHFYNSSMLSFQFSHASFFFMFFCCKFFNCVCACAPVHLPRSTEVTVVAHTTR